MTIDETRRNAAFVQPPISAAEFHQLQAKDMPEARFQDVVVAAARRLGWLVYHTHDSRRSEAGYPDLHLVHAGRGISMLRELKTQKGRVSPAQQTWIEALTAAGVDAAIWRPLDWFDGTIPGVLFPSEGPWTQ